MHPRVFLPCCTRRVVTPCITTPWGLRSARAPARASGLYRATVSGLGIDEDRGARVELVLHLVDFRGERDLLYPIVGPLTRDERFEDPAQRVRTEQAMWNDHDRAASV